MIVGGWDGLSLDIWVTPTNLGVFGSFLSVVSEYLTKQLKEGRVYLAHSSRAQSVIVGKARQREREAAAHRASTVRKQRDRCWGSAHILLCIESGNRSHVMVLSTIRVAFPLS